MRRVAIRTRDSLITPATYEPITPAEVKLQTRLGNMTAEDALLDIYIAKARSFFEGITGRQLMPATWELWLDGFPMDTTIELPKSPLLDVVSVKYIDGDGTEQTLDDTLYTVTNPQGENPERGSISLLSSTSTWPSASERAYAVKIRYEAGYVDTSVSPLSPNVPAIIKGFLLQLVGDSYEFRSLSTEIRASLLEIDPDDSVIRHFKTAARIEPWRWETTPWL
jgi:uncharacterized phiE125 gp8 family phage protein